MADQGDWIHSHYQLQQLIQASRFHFQCTRALSLVSPGHSCMLKTRIYTSYPSTCTDLFLLLSNNSEHLLIIQILRQPSPEETLGTLKRVQMPLILAKSMLNVLLSSLKRLLAMCTHVLTSTQSGNVQTTFLTNRQRQSIADFIRPLLLYRPSIGTLRSCEQYWRTGWFSKEMGRVDPQRC